MSQTTIKTAITVRQMVIRLIDAIPEELFDVQPAAFNNTIRWNLGHIVTCLDGLLSKGLPFNSELPESYPALFGTKTRPSEWTVTPPSKEELVQYLNRQVAGLSAVSPSALEEKLQTPINLGPITFETAGELFAFTTIHETMHSSAISALLRVIKHEQA
ncbi:DinB family protein [Paenibacillus sp. MBLB4367]|uniref:DinB family protein n=1 Tax=Paenibacillus sp. MBLB4367 TaxID=3384767 RepID=UPI0039081078